MRLGALAVFLLIGVSVFAQPSPLQGAQTLADSAISEITVGRQGCFGSCPVYTLTLRKGSRSEYVGNSTVGNKIFGGSGHYSAEPVSAETFDRLSKAVTDFDFFNLADQYGPGAEDIEEVIVTVKAPRRSKSVTIYDPRNAPFPLWTLLTLADGVAANLHWEDLNNARLGFYLPEAISQVKAEYTEQARQAKLQGYVQVYVQVQADGTTSTEHMMVARGLGMGLDQKAVEAVSRWKFKPAQINGKPMSWVTNVLVNFRLDQ
jgi:TonB family protein